MSHPARAAAAPVPDATAHFPAIRRTGQQTRIASPPRRWHRRTTVPQTGQRTGHSARRGTVSYLEIPIGTSRAEIHQIPPFGKLERLSRHDFDDTHALFVLPAPPPAKYNDNITNIRSWPAVFANRSENRSEKAPAASDHNRRSRGPETGPTHHRVHQVHRPANTPRRRPRRQRAEHYLPTPTPPADSTRPGRNGSSSTVKNGPSGWAGGPVHQR